MQNTTCCMCAQHHRVAKGGLCPAIKRPPCNVAEDKKIPLNTTMVLSRPRDHPGGMTIYAINNFTSGLSSESEPVCTSPVDSFKLTLSVV